MYVYKGVFVILVHTCGVRGICHLGAYKWGEGYMSSLCINVEGEVYVVLVHTCGGGVYVVLVHTVYTCGGRGVCRLCAYIYI